MFDIGWGELVVIGIVALIAIGPKELPGVLRTFGQTMAKIRRMAAEFQGQFQEALREAEMADLKKQADEMASSVSDIANFDPMASAKKEMEAAFNPEPTPPASAGAPEPTPPPIDVPLPEPTAPITAEDFARAEAPPAKQIGGAG